MLPGLLAALARQHPQIQIELVPGDALSNLLEREADIAVRMLRPQQELLVARRIGEVELGLHAHQSYLQQHGTPHTLADLAQHALIGFDTETPFIRSVGKSLQGVFTRDNFALRSDSDLAHWALIQAGAGIGICQVALARRRPELVRLLPEQVALPLETWITMHENLRHSPRCRATFDALVEGLEQHVA